MKWAHGHLTALHDTADLVEFFDRSFAIFLLEYPQVVVSWNKQDFRKSPGEGLQTPLYLSKRVGDVTAQNQDIVRIVAGREIPHPLTVGVIVDMDVRQSKDSHQSLFAINI